MTRKYDVAVLGATGIVGKTLIELLAERDFPFHTVYPLASKESEGEFVEVNGEQIEVLDVEHFDWVNVQLCFFVDNAAMSLKYAQFATDAGCIVIDCSSAFVDNDEIPLVIPGVNSEAIENYRNTNIIACPSSDSIQLMVAVKPLYEAFGIEKIILSSYQSVSGMGMQAVEELAKQCANLLSGKPVENKLFTHQIAFNCIPQTGDLTEQGATKEEMQLANQCQRILADYDLQLNATFVRVPVFYGYGQSVYIETKQPISVQQAADILAQTPNVSISVENECPTQISHASGTDLVYIGRIREDQHNSCALNLWIVADNTRKGAATNSIEIAELLVNEYLN